MSRAENKASRLLQVEAMLLSHPEGLAQSEIARRLGVNRSTVGRYLPDLPKHIYIDDDGRWRLDREAYLVQVRFSLHEALAVHLASRLLATRTDRQNPHAAAALRKLGAALERLAPRISQHLGQSADIMDDVNLQRQDPVYLQALEKLTLAWAEQRKTRIWHRLEATDQVYQYTFSPYFIEPYAVGQTTHVIGWREPPGAQRTFKIERIERIELLREHYEIPADFDPRSLLADAWGIWYTESEPVEVKLRFHPGVARRVSETRWHRSQIIETQPDGSLLWRASVAEPHEMMSWIRGWGADVEVLAPEGLREELLLTVEQLGEQYQMRPPSQRQPYQWLYAKTDRQNPDNIHLLLYHMIDVGQVALAMWNEVFPDSFRYHIAQQLNLSVEQTGCFVAFITSLHDLGKASPAYQKKYSPPWLQKKLGEVGFVLNDPVRYSAVTNDKMTSHAYITTWALPPLLVEYCGLDAKFSRKIGHSLGGHHGAWPINSINFNFDDSAYPAWDTARRELIWESRNVFQPPVVLNPPTDEALNVFLTLLSGLASVADWLGSRDDDQSFPFVKEVLTAREYAQRSQNQAKRMLHDLGWTGWQPNHAQLDFGTMFQYLDLSKTVEPRPIQQQIIKLTSNLTTPALIIIEAPTGIGKTEIAFYLADTLLQKHHVRGLYVAMPTQATSNQMFERTADFLSQRYPKEIVNLQLAHGQAAFNEQLEKIQLHIIGDDETDGRVVAMSWFNEKNKRTLLAPFGVGTVDQTLMGVLQTKHFFVRLLGLSHKVIIFDEVHAYDTYMSTLFVLLLQWLRAIGTSVIMLSATLPSETRRKFVQAFTGRQHNLDDHYPAVTIASSNSESAQTQSLQPPDDIALDIHWLDVAQQVEYILSLARKGGCIAVICNTVTRSQLVFQQLLDAKKNGELQIEQENLILFHARFPPVWRQEIEAKTKQLFGKPQKDADGKLTDYRPTEGPAIIIATQVIEQSLDLDFDAIITDLAPMDLLIQRAGRLHRHNIRNSQRHGHSRQLVIVQPKLDEQAVPQFGNDELVYERYVLLRTYRALQKYAKDNFITLPKQTIELIEAVYDTKYPFENEIGTWQSALKDAYQKMRRDQQDAQKKAKKQTTSAPDCEMLLYETNLGLEEDNPAIHQSFQAKTRDIGPTLSLICLYKSEKEGHVCLDPNDPNTTFDLAFPPDIDLTKQLLQWRINVQQWALLNHFLVEEPSPEKAPSAWRKNSVLRHVRTAIFQSKEYPFEDEKYSYILSLNRDFGLALKKLPKREPQ